MFVGREDIGVELPHVGCQFQEIFQLYLSIQESQEKGRVGGSGGDSHTPDCFTPSPYEGSWYGFFVRAHRPGPSQNPP